MLLLLRAAKFQLMRFEFGLHMSVKFCPDRLRFAGVIREKPIGSKYILRCHAYAWQSTIIRKRRREEEEEKQTKKKIKINDFYVIIFGFLFSLVRLFIMRISPVGVSSRRISTSLTDRATSRYEKKHFNVTPTISSSMCNVRKLKVKTAPYIFLWQLSCYYITAI